MIDNDKLAQAAIEFTKKYPAQRMLQDAFIEGARWALSELDPLCNQGAELIEKLQAKNGALENALEKINKCGSCNKSAALPLHICPFKSEIHDDDETTCNCCEDCQYECRMSI